MGGGVSASFTAEHLPLKSHCGRASGTQCSSTWGVWNHLWGTVPGGVLPWGLKQACAQCCWCGSSSSSSETPSLNHAVNRDISPEALPSLLCCWFFSWTSEPGVWGDLRQIYLRKNAVEINERKSLKIILVVHLDMIKSGLDMPLRFIDSLRLEKIFKIMSSSCHAIPTKPTNRALSATPTRFLYTSMDSESTTSVGSPFQRLTTFSRSFRNCKPLIDFSAFEYFLDFAPVFGLCFKAGKNTSYESRWQIAFVLVSSLYFFTLWFLGSYIKIASSPGLNLCFQDA